MKIVKTSLILFFCLGISFTSNAQFWKKLKKKAQEKISKAEDKIIDKLDKKTDKKIDESLDGKKDKKKPVSNKSYGTASINHSVLYGMFSVNDLTKTVINKEGNKATVIGHWRTSSADVFDGYRINIKDFSSLDDLSNKTFKIPEEASLKLAYNALVKGEYTYKRGQVHAPQSLEMKTGSVTFTLNKDQNITISFTGNVVLSNHNLVAQGTDATPASINGMISTNAPEYKITKVKKETQKNATNTLTEQEKLEMLKKASPTVNIPSTFSFSKSISVKMTDDSGEAQFIDFLTGTYPDIYAISVATKEMQGQKMLVVNTPKSSTMFMDMAGMKIKKTTSLSQLGSQYNMDDKLPEDGDFTYKKTGNTKTILGYNCEEFKVDYNYTNSKGSASFWVSKDFPIQNKAIPMIGMKMNNPHFSGFVLEMNTLQNGKSFKLEVTDVKNITVNINTATYKNMGF